MTSLSPCLLKVFIRRQIWQQNNKSRKSTRNTDTIQYWTLNWRMHHKMQTNVTNFTVRYWKKFILWMLSCCIPMSEQKGNFSNTPYQALGPELIPVYRQSAHMWLLKCYVLSVRHLLSISVFFLFVMDCFPVCHYSASMQYVLSSLNLKLSPNGRLPLLSTRHAVTFPAEERHRPPTSTKLYCLMTEAHRCEQLAQCCNSALSRCESNPRPIDHKCNALPLRYCASLMPEYWAV